MLATLTYVLQQQMQQAQAERQDKQLSLFTQQMEQQIKRGRAL